MGRMWFCSYLAYRFQYTLQLELAYIVDGPNVIWCSPGIVLGPILFLLYTADLAQLVESHGLHVHLYADDTQV